MAELVLLSIPIMISQASEALMMFTDRLLLTPLGKEYPAASMAGMFGAEISRVFFFGLLGYINPLVGQYFGAGQKTNCAKVLVQGLIFSLLIFPVVAALGRWLMPYYFGWAGIHADELVLVIKYFNVIMFGLFFALASVAFASYFAGIGDTRCVMIINMTGMLANIPISYYLIHHGLFGYCQGIEGAALGVSISQGLMATLYTLYFFRPKHAREFAVAKAFVFAPPILKKLLYFGSPTGIEFFLIFFAFSTYVNLFHSYGTNEALAKM